MDIYKILNEGPGSPGATARTITADYLRRKKYLNIDKIEIFRKMLKDYSNTYSNLGMTHFDDDLIERIILNSKGELLFIIFSDILVTNYNQFVNNTDGLLSNFDLIFDIVLENYNNIYGQNLSNVNAIKQNILKFINDEMSRIEF